MSKLGDTSQSSDNQYIPEPGDQEKNAPGRISEPEISFTNASIKQLLQTEATQIRVDNSDATPKGKNTLNQAAHNVSTDSSSDDSSSLGLPTLTIIGLGALATAAAVAAAIRKQSESISRDFKALPAFQAAIDEHRRGLNLDKLLSEFKTKLPDFARTFHPGEPVAPSPVGDEKVRTKGILIPADLPKDGPNRRIEVTAEQARQLGLTIAKIENPANQTDRTITDAAVHKSVEVELKQISDEVSLRSKIQDGIKQSKEGIPITFNLETRVPLIGIDGKPLQGATQASILYEELKKAYPNKAFVFSKPDLKPGDQGYSEIPAPQVKKDGIHLSTKENQITTAKEINLPNGTKLPAGSKFAIGTLLDGSTVMSSDPAGKVWATTPDGQQVQIADAGKAATVPIDSFSADPKQAGQLPEKGDHIIVRTGTGTDPEGKPLLDAYPISDAELKKNYKPGTGPDMYAPQPKLADHLLLPKNVTIQSDTKYGPSTASGAKEDYFMQSGFADAKDATAKNYTGVTDSRSAQELLRVRSEVGLSGPTQVEAGLLDKAGDTPKGENARLQKSVVPEGLFGLSVTQSEFVDEMLARLNTIEQGRKGKAITAEVLADCINNFIANNEQLKTDKALKNVVVVEGPGNTVGADVLFLDRLGDLQIGGVRKGDHWYRVSGDNNWEATPVERTQIRLTVGKDLLDALKDPSGRQSALTKITAGCYSMLADLEMAKSHPLSATVAHGAPYTGGSEETLEFTKETTATRLKIEQNVKERFERQIQAPHGKSVAAAPEIKVLIERIMSFSNVIAGAEASIGEHGEILIKTSAGGKFEKSDSFKERMEAYLEERVQLAKTSGAESESKKWTEFQKRFKADSNGFLKDMFYTAELKTAGAQRPGAEKGGKELSTGKKALLVGVGVTGGIASGLMLANDLVPDKNIQMEPPKPPTEPPKAPGR